MVIKRNCIRSIFMFMLLMQLTYLNAAKYELAYAISMQNREVLLIGRITRKSGVSEWAAILYAPNIFLQAAWVADVGWLFDTKLDGPPLIFYPVREFFDRNEVPLSEGRSGSYINLQFLHDASSDEIQKEMGMALDPVLESFIHNEKNWNVIVSTLNDHRNDRIDGVHYNTTELIFGKTQAISAAIAPLLRSVDDDLKVLVGKIL